ncbi:hypothetical protein N0V86_000370 [Didymella sp. IMI 355093]|nr:hypothetical protein N0V86_000370 [Didymella sp. IMI 355093]
MFEKTTFHSTEGGFLCSTEGVFNPAWLKDATETQETIATRSFVPSVEDGHHPGTPDLGQRPYGQEIDTLHRQYIDPQVYHNLPIDSLQAENNNLRAQLSCTLAVLENEKEMNNNLRNQLYSAQTVIEVHSEIRKAELEHYKIYTGPSVPDMIRDKTLAANIIKFHNHPTSDSILDDDNLNLLQRFVEDPSKREQILRDEGIEPEESLKGKQTSLAAYAVWAHDREDVDDGILTKDDIEMLRVWFETGKGGKGSK